MLAAFNGTWDWTAIGTLALAVVTGVALAFAWGSLKQTHRQIHLGQEQLEQTQREIELSRAEVGARICAGRTNPGKVQAPEAQIESGPCT
jgi:hypothetical protein